MAIVNLLEICILPSSFSEYILLNDFTCRETGLHNADWFNRMIASGSIQRYAVYTAHRLNLQHHQTADRQPGTFPEALL